MDLKALVHFPQLTAILDALSEDLRGISLSIWNHPELAYEEHLAHKLLTDYLENQGFKVQRAFHLPTAFSAEYTSVIPQGPQQGSLSICFLSEYDALPGLGHACGHNLIAICGVAAAVALKRFFDEIHEESVMVEGAENMKPKFGDIKVSTHGIVVESPPPQTK